MEEYHNFNDSLSVVEEESDSDLFSDTSVECGDTDNFPVVTSLSTSFLSTSTVADDGVMRPNKGEQKSRYNYNISSKSDISRRRFSSNITNANFTSNERKFLGLPLRSYTEYEPSLEGEMVDWGFFRLESRRSNFR